MPAQIIDGTSIANEVISKIKMKVDKIKSNQQITPFLAVILVGDDPASKIYVGKKCATCKKVGIQSKIYNLSSKTNLIKILNLIQELNQDQQVSGILVQLPLPAHINKNAILSAIAPEKDVDGFHPINFGMLAQQQSGWFMPCTAAGIKLILQKINIDVKGMHAVVIGISTIVGMPTILYLLQEGVTVTACHIDTVNLFEEVTKADILVVATGNPGLIKEESIKQGAIVIDVGINRTKDGKIVGDVEFQGAAEKAAWLTPVPGGVGPITVAMLMQNTLLAYERQNLGACLE